MHTVSWGKSARHKFIAAGDLRTFAPPEMPAVFAITYKQNPQTKPKSHTVLYFGHADDLAREMPQVNNEIHEMWTQGGNDMQELFVFMYPMPGSTRGQRTTVHQQLVLEYSPQGNY